MIPSSLRSGRCSDDSADVTFVVETSMMLLNALRTQPTPLSAGS
jgi:hypothetical protein